MMFSGDRGFLVISIGTYIGYWCSVVLIFFSDAELPAVETGLVVCQIVSGVVFGVLSIYGLWICQQGGVTFIVYGVEFEIPGQDGFR